MGDLTKSFSAAEFRDRSRTGGDVPVEYKANVEALAIQLQMVRDHIGCPMRVLSGWRSVEHNKACGGAERSMHLVAKAADIWVEELSPEDLHGAVADLIRRHAILDGGLGLYPAGLRRPHGWVHYDLGPAGRRWTG